MPNFLIRNNEVIIKFIGLNLEEIELIDPKKRPIKKAKNSEIKLTLIVTHRGGRSLGKTSTI